MESHERSGQDGTRLVIRSSPRLLAPDWAVRVRRAPAGAWILIFVFLLVGSFRVWTISGLLTAVLVVVLVFGVPYTAKALNARVVITQTSIESRDALRRTTRADPASIVSLKTVRREILGPRFALTRVVMLDRDGRAHLRLSWDSYSDDDFKLIAERLDLQFTPA